MKPNIMDTEKKEYGIFQRRLVHFSKMLLLVVMSIVLIGSVFSTMELNYVHAAHPELGHEGENDGAPGTDGNSGGAVPDISKDSWLDGKTDDTIYQNSNGEDGAIDIGDPGEESDPGMIEDMLIGVVKGIGDWAHGMMKSLGISINSSIFGRVGGGGVKFTVGKETYRTSLLTFELKPGNPYGIVASAAYGTLRGIVYVLIFVLAFGKLVLSSYKSNSAQALSALKDSIGSFALALVLLTIMPYVMDILLYVRDVVLNAMGLGLTDKLHLSRDGLDFAKMFEEGADASLMGANMYLGAAILGLYFAFTYVGVALSFVVSFCCFPIVCLNMQKDKQALTDWWKQVFGYMLIPVADCLLIMIPMAFGKLGTSTPVQVLQFFVCTMVIPARGVIRQHLGIQTNSAMEMAGVGAMFGAMTMARGVIGGAIGNVKRAAGSIGEARADKKTGEMYQELSENGFESGMGQGIPVQQTMGANVGDLPGGATGTTYMGGMDPKAQEILEKNVNIKNVDNPMFNNISNAKKAEIYKKRAQKTMGKAIGGAILGTAGYAAGASAGMGASTFLSPQAKGMAIGAGAMAGAAVGGTVGSAVGGTAGGRGAHVVAGAATGSAVGGPAGGLVGAMVGAAVGATAWAGSDQGAKDVYAAKENVTSAVENFHPVESMKTMGANIAETNQALFSAKKDIGSPVDDELTYFGEQSGPINDLPIDISNIVVDCWENRDLTPGTEGNNVRSQVGYFSKEVASDPAFQNKSQAIQRKEVKARAIEHYAGVIRNEAQKMSFGEDIGEAQREQLRNDWVREQMSTVNQQFTVKKIKKFEDLR